MKLPYPQTIPCAFDGFPVALDIRMGASGGDIVPGASLGSKFTLTRTSKCGVPQGDYVVGSPLPECRMIYSDTGRDDDFTIKVSFFGYGTFYRLTRADTHARFQVYKAIAIETPSGGEKFFGDTFDCETLIPAAQDVTALFAYDGPIARYTDKTTSGTDDECGYVWIDGTKYYIRKGASISIHGASGEYKISIVNGTVVIS